MIMSLPISPRRVISQRGSARAGMRCHILLGFFFLFCLRNPSLILDDEEESFRRWRKYQHLPQALIIDKH